MGKSKDLATRVGIDDNATSTAITIDSSERVGIGDTAPTTDLVVKSANSTPIISESTGVNSYIKLANNNDGSGNFIGGETTNINLWTENVKRLNIDGSGRVTTPYQPSMSGRAIRPVSTAGYVNLNVNLYLNDLQHNIGNHWNNSTGVWTCPVAGRYWVFVSILIDDNMSNGNVARYEILKNGSEFFRGYDQSYNSGSTYGGMIASGGIFNCSANDTITIKGTNGTLHSGSESTFTICLLG